MSEGANGEPLASCNLWEPGDEYPTIDSESGDEINDLCGDGDLGDTCGPFNNPGWEECVYTAIPLYNITLNSQAEVDNFQTNYGGGGTCDTVTSTLRISGSDITDLSPLSALINVDALDISDNSNLANIDGLSNLGSVGYLSVNYNQSLSNLDGLSGLTNTGRTLRITDNPSLDNIDGLSGITSVGSYLDIRRNASLTSVDALSSLISVGKDVYVSDNSSLSDCTGLTTLLDNVDDGDPGPGPGAAGIPDVGGDLTMEGNVAGCNNVILEDGFESPP